MSSKRSLHELANSVDTIGDIRTCDGGILEDTNSAFIELSVAEWSISRVG